MIDANYGKCYYLDACHQKMNTYMDLPFIQVLSGPLPESDVLKRRDLVAPVAVKQDDGWRRWHVAERGRLHAIGAAVLVIPAGAVDHSITQLVHVETLRETKEMKRLL
jgi:hypothetical protein